MRMSVNSLDSTATAGGRGQIHANLAFASTPEHDIGSPLSLKDPRPSYVRSPPPPPPPKDKPPKLSSAMSAESHRSAAIWHPEPYQSRQSSVDDLPPAPSPPQQPRSFGVFQPSLSTNAGEVKSPSISDVRNSTPKALNGPGPAVGGVQLRSKPSMRKEDREKSHLYEELPWAEREGAAAAAMAAVVPGAETHSGAKERRRANPLYGERSSTDTLPPKPDSSSATSHPDNTSALTHRLQQHCCIFSGLIGALAAIAIAALAIAILASTGTLQGGTQGNNTYPANATELMQRLDTLKSQVLALQETVGQQELKIIDYATKLNITASAFSKCELASVVAIKQAITDFVYDGVSKIIVGAFCNRGTLSAGPSTTDNNNATINGYQCQCTNATSGCVLWYWRCPTRLF